MVSSEDLDEQHCEGEDETEGFTVFVIRWPAGFRDDEGVLFGESSRRTLLLLLKELIGASTREVLLGLHGNSFDQLPLSWHVSHCCLGIGIVLPFDLFDDGTAEFLLHFVQWIQEAIVNGE